MERILIISHVIAGVLALVSGILAAFFGKKGNKLHKQVGNIFYWAMFWVFISTLLIALFIRFNIFLTVIGVFSFYMAFSGVRVLKIKTDMKVKSYDWIAAILTATVGVFLFGFGLYILVTQGLERVVAYLCLIFGIATFMIARININGFRRKGAPEKMWWWFAHMNSLGGALISCITAFLVQNGDSFGMPNSISWLLWVAPGVAGGILISYYNKKYRLQFGLPIRQKR